MTITPIQGLISSSVLQRQSLYAQNATKSVSDNAAVSDVTASSDSSAVEIAPSSLLSSKNSASSAFYKLSLSLAQTGSQVQTAQQGTNQILSVLSNLQTLAQQAASSNGDTDSSASLDSQFQSLYGTIDNVATNTRFDGKKLLDGTFSFSKTSGDTSTAETESTPLPNLSTQGLFGSSNPNVQTQTNAQAAISAIYSAITTVSSADAQINQVSGQLNEAEATVESAKANIVASHSTLTEDDLQNGETNGIGSLLFGNVAALSNAQTHNLSGDYLEKFIS